MPPRGEQQVVWTAAIQDQADAHGDRRDHGGRADDAASCSTSPFRCIGRSAGSWSCRATRRWLGRPSVIPGAPPAEERDVSDGGLRAVAQRAVTNYLAGQRTNLLADLDPAAVVSLPTAMLDVRSVRSITKAARDRVAVEVAAADDSGIQWTLRYELTVVRRDRWYVRASSPIPSRPRVGRDRPRRSAYGPARLRRRRRHAARTPRYGVIETTTLEVSRVRSVVEGGDRVDAGRRTARRPWRPRRCCWRRRISAQAASDTSQKVGDEARGWLTVLFLVVAGFAALPVIGRLDVGRGFALAALVLILGGLAFAQGSCALRDPQHLVVDRLMLTPRARPSAGWRGRRCLPDPRDPEPERGRTPARSSSGRFGWSSTAATGGCSRSTATGCRSPTACRSSASSTPPSSRSRWCSSPSCPSPGRRSRRCRRRSTGSRSRSGSRW